MARRSKVKRQRLFWFRRMETLSKSVSQLFPGALVFYSFLLLVVRHLFLVAMHLFLVASLLLLVRHTLLEARHFLRLLDFIRAFFLFSPPRQQVTASTRSKVILCSSRRLPSPSNKCIASSNKCLTSSNKDATNVTSASLRVSHRPTSEACSVFREFGRGLRILHFQGPTRIRKLSGLK